MDQSIEMDAHKDHPMHDLINKNGEPDPPQTDIFFLEMAAFFTSSLLVCGVFSNLIAIGVFSSPKFNRMSFKVHMKLLCCLNMLKLLLGLIRQHTFTLDLVTEVNTDRRREGCIYLTWFSLLFDNVMPYTVAFVVYNRIKAQRTPDACLRKIDSIRVPVLLNFTTTMLNSVPVSTYIEGLEYATSMWNRTECIFLYMHPYTIVSNATEPFAPAISNLPLLEYLILFALFLVLVVEMIIRQKRKRQLWSMESNSLSSVSDMSDESMERKDWSKSLSRKSNLNEVKSAQDQHSSKYAVSTALSQGVMDANKIKDSLLSLTDTTSQWIDLEERDESFTGMTVVMVTFFFLCDFPRQIIRSSLIKESFPEVRDENLSFAFVCFLDILHYFYLAALFLILCASSSVFRNEAYSMLFAVDVPVGISDVSLQGLNRRISRVLGDTGKAFAFQSDSKMRASKTASFASDVPRRASFRGSRLDSLYDDPSKSYMSVGDFELKRGTFRLKSTIQQHLQQYDSSFSSDIDVTAGERNRLQASGSDKEMEKNSWETRSAGTAIAFPVSAYHQGINT